MKWCVTLRKEAFRCEWVPKLDCLSTCVTFSSSPIRTIASTDIDFHSAREWIATSAILLQLNYEIHWNFSSDNKRYLSTFGNTTLDYSTYAGLHCAVCYSLVILIYFLVKFNMWRKTRISMSGMFHHFLALIENEGADMMNNDDRMWGRCSFGSEIRVAVDCWWDRMIDREELCWDLVGEMWKMRLPCLVLHRSSSIITTG